MKKEKQFLKKMLKNVKSATSYENICHYSKVMLFFVNTSHRMEPINE